MDLRSPILKSISTVLTITAIACLFTTPAALASTKPIRIGVIGAKSTLDGKAIFQAAELAASKINSQGGINGRPIKLLQYNDHFKATNAIRSFQRAVKRNHVVAMTGVFGGAIGVSLEPWAARLKTPLIISGAADNTIATNIHKHWPQYRYIFQEYPTSTFLAKSACTFAKQVLAKKLHYKRVAIFSEKAGWTKPLNAEYKKCLPKAGLNVVDTINFSTKTQDYSPIFNRIEKDNAQALMVSIAYVGAKPVTQWHQQQVPALMAGINGQATSPKFWKRTNGSAEGVLGTTVGANGVPVTPKTPAFYKAFTKRFHQVPAYSAYSEYDAMFTLKNAIERSHSTQASKLVSALEKTNRVGVSWPIQFYGPKQKYTHALVYKGIKTDGVVIQWQHGKQVVVWPKRVAQGKIIIPPFVKQSNQ